jgi:hypothetical protein
MRVPVNNLTVGNRHQHRTGGADSAANASGRRMLARRLLFFDSGSSGSLLLQVGSTSIISSSSSSGSRSLLQAGSTSSISGDAEMWGPDVPGSNSSSNGWTKVWVSYTRLLPANTSSLLCALAGACGLSLDGPAVLSSAPCGLAVRQALLGTGLLGVDGPAYEQWMTDDPMVREFTCSGFFLLFCAALCALRCFRLSLRGPAVLSSAPCGLAATDDPMVRRYCYALCVCN